MSLILNLAGFGRRWICYQIERKVRMNKGLVKEGLTGWKLNMSPSSSGCGNAE
jgi:hypothetical protein